LRSQHFLVRTALTTFSLGSDVGGLGTRIPSEAAERPSISYRCQQQVLHYSRPDEGLTALRRAWNRENGRERCNASGISTTTPLCTARLRDGSRCRSLSTDGDLCEHHARLAAELGRERVVNGDHARERSARERIAVEDRVRTGRTHIAWIWSPVIGPPGPRAHGRRGSRTVRRVLLEAATNTTRESWATCSCPECGKSFRQEISVPDHGARIKAVETLLREGLGRVGEAEVAEPRMPASVAEVEALSWVR
jgi:hypothetical protein